MTTDLLMTFVKSVDLFVVIAAYFAMFGIRLIPSLRPALLAHGTFKRENLYLIGVAVLGSAADWLSGMNLLAAYLTLGVELVALTLWLADIAVALEKRRAY